MTRSEINFWASICTALACIFAVIASGTGYFLTFVLFDWLGLTSTVTHTGQAIQASLLFLGSSMGAVACLYLALRCCAPIWEVDIDGKRLDDK